MAAERWSDKVMSDMEVEMKERCVTKFLLIEKMATVDVHGHLWNTYGDQQVDVSTVRQQMMCCNSGSLPLVQIFRSAACRLLFISVENA